MNNPTLFAIQFGVVFLLGLQSKLVMNSRYLMAATNSAGICVCQFLFARAAVSGDTTTLLWAMVGSSMGISCSIYVYDQFMRPKPLLGRSE